jgi:ABC-type molybdate transport system permease subunit
METIMHLALPPAAIGFALLYLLLGGGFGGAILVFIIAKMFGK